MTARLCLRLVIFTAAILSAHDLKVRWIHGGDPCSSNTFPAFQVHAYDADTVIIRENKCINYEGPFIYLLFGRDRVLMRDTSAAPAANSGITFPVHETIRRVVHDCAQKHGKRDQPLVVTHSRTRTAITPAAMPNLPVNRTRRSWERSSLMSRASSGSPTD